MKFLQKMINVGLFLMFIGLTWVGVVLIRSAGSCG